MNGRGWTELAKETPGFRFYLAPITTTLFRFTNIYDCTLRDYRSLSSTTTMQWLGTNRLLWAVIGMTPLLADLGQEASRSEVVGHRPDNFAASQETPPESAGVNDKTTTRIPQRTRSGDVNEILMP